jgi:hypothetical protein
LSNPRVSQVKTRKNPNGRLHSNSFGKEKKLEETSGYFIIVIAEPTTGAIQEEVDMQSGALPDIAGSTR